ncbi:MAG: ERCC4 domain-containing protein [Chitinophagaceae bacterium]
MAISNSDKKQEKVIEVFADDREKNDSLLLALCKAGNTVVRTVRLITGDYLVNNLLIERKTIPDLCASITDGRLFCQASALAAAGLQPLIILEGTSADLKASAMKREAIQGALITLSLLFRIPVLRSMSPEETARLILYATRQIENSGIPQQIYPRPFPGRKHFSRKQKMQIHVLQGFPGIGPVLSKQLLNKFGTLSAIFNASPQELVEVAGIGKATIKRIRDLLN